MAQKHLQLLRNNNVYDSYGLALAALTGWDFTTKPLADGTPILARYTDNENNQKTLLGVVNNGTIDIINNVADYLLRNYTAFTGDVTTITSDDDVKTAIAKLVKKIENSSAAAATQVAEGTDAGNNMEIVPTTSATDGHVTYTINLSDVASATALTQEISDRESGDTALSDRLGNGVTSANTATAQLTALSGDSNSVSGDTSVEGAKRYADEKVRATLDGLDASTVFGESKVVIDVTQENGQITATAANLTGVKLDGYAEGTDADVAATDTLGQALGKLQAQINAMDLTVVSGAGEVITSVSEEDGKVSATKTAIKDVTLTGYAKTSASGAIESTDDVEDALSKLENNIEAAKSATTVASADNSINVTPSTGGTDINVNIKSGEHVLAKTGNAGLYTDIKLSGITPSSTTVKEEYALLGTDGMQLGDTVKVYKDSSLVSMELVSGGTAEAPKQYLRYTYVNDSGNTAQTDVDVSLLLAENEFKNGVTVDANGIVHGVVDPTSEAFLTVGADGFKLAGVQDAIDTAISGLDFTTDAAVAGQYVAAIEETDGIVAVKTRANVSEAVLNNYAKGSDATAVAATDTVNAAISKLENQVDNAKAAATTKVAEGTDAGNNMKIVPTTGADKSVTYTINLTDVASASALADEISHRKAVDGINGDAYTADTTAHYISGDSVNSLYAADKALDTALYNESTARTAAIDAAIESLDYTDTAATGQYVSEVNEANGIISVSRLNVSEAVLNNYTKGSKPQDTAVSSSDTINQAISKLEHQIDDVEGNYLTGITVNGVNGTVANNVATVEISGSSINLGTGYTGSESGTPTTADTVNQAIAKLYNKSNANTSKGKTITITSGESSTNFEVNVDNTTAATDAMALYESDNHNAIQDTKNGLYVSSIWDCGTYDKPAGN